MEDRAGDAAHSFPPTGGLGLNSGLADVHNLAYKIAAVQQGWAGDGLLDSYQTERRHIAMVNSLQSVKNGKKIFSFLKALGVAGIKDPNEARANLLKTVHDPDKQKMIAEEVEDQREHFDNVCYPSNIHHHKTNNPRTAWYSYWLCVRYRRSPFQCVSLQTKIRTRCPIASCLDQVSQYNEVVRFGSD
jgi:hypothetical protein